VVVDERQQRGAGANRWLRDHLAITFVAAVAIYVALIYLRLYRWSSGWRAAVAAILGVLLATLLALALRRERSGGDTDPRP
jgi:hypothetical protein